MKMTVDQAFRKARTALKDNDREQAVEIYRAMLDRFPASKRIQAELDALSRPQIVNTPKADLDAVAALHGKGHVAEAMDAAAELLTRYPDCEILNNMAGAVAARLGRFELALRLYDKAVLLAPDYFEALSNRGNTLRQLKRAEDALADFDAALKLNPSYVEAHVNRGIVLAGLNRTNEALASYGRAIKLDATRAEAYNNRGNVMRSLHRLEEALADYAKAVSLKPDFASALTNRGNALNLLNREAEAIASYDEALRWVRDNPEAWYGRGGALKNLKRFDEALASQQQVLLRKADHAGALGEVLDLQARIASWRDKGAEVALSRLPQASALIQPFYILNIADDPARQLAAARAWSAAHLPPATDGTFGPRQPGRIRVGYFSADFHNHATMYLIARLFELHDRDRFEIHAFSYGPDADDTMRRRLRAAADYFHEVAPMSDDAIAAVAREAGIDIAIDLKGHTTDSRTSLFAHRAAPVQVAYLGYPGTSGSTFIDYAIADRITVPEDQARHFSEKLLYLPNSYQVNDDRRAIADATPTRAACGLPETGFVFASFNASYKISPSEFDIWMRLLAQVEGSVLWLLKDNASATANLRREAEARGIDPARLIFADRAALPDHLARHRRADLFLDTFKVNAHTTASDALWAGLPVLTKAGTSFVARVGASLLTAIGLPELITETDATYEATALALATDPARLAALKAKLEANRLTTPLFDTAQTVREIEALYAELVPA